MRSNVTRLACFLTLSAIISAADASKIEPQPQNVVLEVKAKLAELLGHYPTSPLLDSLATQVLAGLPGYQQQLDRAFVMAGNRLTLDIIVMSHGELAQPLGAPHNRVNISQPELDSQKVVANILETIKPELIGFEGAATERLTLESLAREFINTSWSLGTVIVQDQARRKIANWTEHDGALMYYHNHPETKMTGMEETPVYLLALALQQAKLNPSLQWDLNRLRSELGLAKTITQLRQNGLSRGAIVAGYTHEQDYRQVLASLPVTARFYQTTSDPAQTQTVAASRYLQK
jgi:hypothetical protein